MRTISHSSFSAELPPPPSEGEDERSEVSRRARAGGGGEQQQEESGTRRGAGEELTFGRRPLFDQRVAFSAQRPIGCGGVRSRK